MKRQMVKVVNYVKMEDEDHLDVLFWQSKSVAERLQEVARLRKIHYHPFPENIIKVVNFSFLREQ